MTARLSTRQYQALSVLAREPHIRRLAWSGCGDASFGYADNPAMRPNKLLMSLPRGLRFPAGVTVTALHRKKMIRHCATDVFWRVYEITSTGLRAYRAAEAKVIA